MPAQRNSLNPKPSLGVISLVLVVGLLVVSGGYLLVRPGHANSCVVSSIMVNSCHPLLGAAVRGYSQPPTNGVKDQALYHEQRIGRELDVIHDYHPVGNNALSADEKYFATRAGSTIYANWKPVSKWADIAANNAGIDEMAGSIKSIAPHKIFLTLHHEPENDVTTDPNCPSVTYKGTFGTPTDYRNMWSYVHQRFADDGVTNVVWVMNYMNYKPWQCLVPDMYPGSANVDWVTFEAYGGSETFNQKVSDMYNLLTADTDATHDFTSKPWGLGEWGVCNNVPQSTVYKYYDDAKAALDNNTFPRLKLYMVYDDNGNNAGMGCLTGYDYAGTLDPTEQQHYNAFADDPALTNGSSTKAGDLNGDGVVNVFDLSILLSDWGTNNTQADLNKDGTVNVFDLSDLLTHWG
jgi:hypothetical protein